MSENETYLLVIFSIVVIFGSIFNLYYIRKFVKCSTCINNKIQKDSVYFQNKTHTEIQKSYGEVFYSDKDD